MNNHHKRKRILQNSGSHKPLCETVSDPEEDKRAGMTVIERLKTLRGRHHTQRRIVTEKLETRGGGRQTGRRMTVIYSDNDTGDKERKTENEIGPDSDFEVEDNDSYCDEDDTDMETPGMDF